MSSLSNDWEKGKSKKLKGQGITHPKVRTGQGKDAEIKISGVNLSKEKASGVGSKAKTGQGADGERKI